MLSTPFFNLVNGATEHCFVWLINTSVIDPVDFVAKFRQKAVAAFSADPPDKDVDEGDCERWIEEDTAEKLTEALADLFMEQLDEVHPEFSGGFLYVNGGYEGGLDSDDLQAGLAGGAFDDVHIDVLAKALMLYVKNLAAGQGVQPLLNTEQGDQ